MVPLWERHGGRVRIFNNSLSGSDATTVSFVAEYPSMTAYGEAADKLMADAEIAQFAARVNAAMVGKLVSGSLSQEVPSH